MFPGRQLPTPDYENCFEYPYQGQYINQQINLFNYGIPSNALQSYLKPQQQLKKVDLQSTREQLPIQPTVVNPFPRQNMMKLLNQQIQNQIHPFIKLLLAQRMAMNFQKNQVSKDAYTIKPISRKISETSTQYSQNELSADQSIESAVVSQFLSTSKNDLLVDVNTQQSALDDVSNNQEMDTETNSNESKNFKCKFCDKTFPTFRQLGGHASKSHPGQSTPYNHMIKVRQERQRERDALKLAKDKYMKLYGKGKVSRCKLLKLKKHFLKIQKDQSTEEIDLE